MTTKIKAPPSPEVKKRYLATAEMLCKRLPDSQIHQECWKLWQVDGETAEFYISQGREIMIRESVKPHSRLIDIASETCERVQNSPTATWKVKIAAREWLDELLGLYTPTVTEIFDTEGNRVAFKITQKAPPSEDKSRELLLDDAEWLPPDRFNRVCNRVLARRRNLNRVNRFNLAFYFWSKVTESPDTNCFERGTANDRISCLVGRIEPTRTAMAYKGRVFSKVVHPLVKQYPKI